MGRRAKGVRQAGQIIVQIGDTTVVFPLDRELIRSRPDALLRAKGLRPLAVDYLRRIEDLPPDPFMDDNSMRAFDDTSMPFLGEFPWNPDTMHDFSSSSSKCREAELSCDIDCTPGIHFARIEDHRRED
jgi:hypothetical protein